MTTTRVTTYSYDFRGRRIATDGEADYYEKRFYDNLDRVTKVDRHDTTPGGSLIARSEAKYDDRGRKYQQIRHGVDDSKWDRSPTPIFESSNAALAARFPPPSQYKELADYRPMV